MADIIGKTSLIFSTTTCSLGQVKRINIRSCKRYLNDIAAGVKHFLSFPAQKHPSDQKKIRNQSFGSFLGFIKRYPYKEVKSTLTPTPMVELKAILFI